MTMDPRFAQEIVKFSRRATASVPGIAPPTGSALLGRPLPIGPTGMLGFAHAVH
jgi:hypothetical protein